MIGAGIRSPAVCLALALLLGGTGCSGSATCAEFCNHFYGCMLTGFLGSTSEADCELRCTAQEKAMVCQDNGAQLGCLNALSCSQLDLSTPDTVIDNIGRYQVCDIKGSCSLDGG